MPKYITFGDINKLRISVKKNTNNYREKFIEKCLEVKENILTFASRNCEEHAPKSRLSYSKFKLFINNIINN